MKISDSACPHCGPKCRAPANRVRKVLRTWRDGEFFTYKCIRCGISGYSHKTIRLPDAVPVAMRPDKNRSKIASWLWKKSRGFYGTEVEKYLVSRSCYLQSDNIRYLESYKNHPSCMIVRFGTDDRPSCVHLTRLVDGKKAGTDRDKIIIGRSIEPIIVYDNPERTELVITEGIEDAASMAIATGWTSWASGAAVRIPALLNASRSFTQVYITVDDDPAGHLAFKKALEIRPDVISINFSKTIEKGIDANKALIKHGKDALLASIEWREAQHRHEIGQIGFHQMERELVWASQILSSVRTNED